MAAVSDLVTDATIRAAAIAAGFHDASIVRYIERRPYRCDGDLDIPEILWLVLSIRRSSESPFEVIGRRKTRRELLELLRNGAYKVSNRAAAAIPGRSYATDARHNAGARPVAP